VLTADCRWAAKQRAAAAVVRAFGQAMTEAGIPDHVDGECPALPCPCQDEGVGERVEQRAAELAAAALGIPADELARMDS
jgi:hypothetical protein